jgi:3-oxoacyl-[acyl-carrier protein] reductase
VSEIAGRRALVTGAGGGIGGAFARALAREGAELVLCDVDAAGLARSAEEVRALGAGVETRVCDLADPSALAALADAVAADPRGLQILVNNAGLLHYGELLDTPADAAERLLAVNLLAPVRLTQRLLPALLARPGGHVLNLCSLAGLVAVRRFGIYSVSKFGLVGYSEALRNELGARLGVTAVCPGLVDTPMFERAVENERRASLARRIPGLVLDPERVAARGVRAIRRNQALVVLSPLARVLWLAKRIHPRLARRH